MYVHVEHKIYTPPCIISSLLSKDLSRVDRISRSIALRTYINYISRLSIEELWNLIDKVTGGLGYTREDRDFVRVIMAGCIIAWPEAIDDGDKVLEIGTGLGRTIYCVLESTSPSNILTIDVSSEILSIALYRNPYPFFQNRLWDHRVNIVHGDAVEIVDILHRIGMKFNHIIHDGGPNPGKNPRLYTKEFLEKLVKLLEPRGSITIFAGRKPAIVSRIYNTLKQLGIKPETHAFPYTPVRVIHGKKIY